MLRYWFSSVPFTFFCFLGSGDFAVLLGDSFFGLESAFRFAVTDFFTAPVADAFWLIGLAADVAGATIC